MNSDVGDKRPRNSEEFRTGASQGDLGHDLGRGRQSSPNRFLGPVDDYVTTKPPSQHSQSHKVTSMQENGMERERA
jgi:hypothetical protein